MLVDTVPLVYIYFVCFFFFLLVFGRKRWESAEKVDLDQRTACKAPVHWSKYTTKEQARFATF